MLSLTRQFGRLDAALRRGTWESQWAIGGTPPPPWPELAGKTLAILGYGHIGRCLARRATAFDMTVLAIRRDTSQPDAHARDEAELEKARRFAHAFRFVCPSWYAPGSTASNRLVRQASYASLAAALTFIIVKLAAWLATGSVAVLSSLVDVVRTLFFAYVALLVARFALAVDNEPMTTIEWNKSHVYPAHHVEYNYTDENTRFNAVKTGQVDLTTISGATYNQAVADVQERLQARVAEIDIEVHEEAFQYWRKFDLTKKKQ